MSSRSAASSSSTRAQALEHGREAFRKQAWGTAYSQLMAADREAQLEAEDLAQLAQAARLIGKEAEGADLLSRAHQAFLSRGDERPAARCAFWMGFSALINGEYAKAGGWLARAKRLLEGHPDCVENGYLLVPEGYRSFHEGDTITAEAIFVRATAVGERFSDKDLTTLALQGQGRALIRQGEIARGVALLDEAMVAVTAGEVSPLNAGGVYCSVLEGCGEIFDLQRAQEWTSALERWCASQPDLVPYRGHCLVRRAELLQLHGAWTEALEWAQRAVEWLSRPTPRPGLSAALYQVGEVQRLRGKFAESEEAYAQATQSSRCPGPGMAQLRFAQGRMDAANAAIRRMADEEMELGPRAKILDSYVEIVLAAKDIPAARVAAEELATIAARQDVAFFHALSLRAAGAVLLAEGNARTAMAELRRSWDHWSELQVPYEAARVRVLVGLASRELGDEENACLELTAARQVFQGLGATVDLSHVETLLSKTPACDAGPLTDREVQVLRLVASGMTNRGIAGKLQISEKTVARHVSNIFTKLGLSSRTAAAAYAYDHNLV
jgi:DNA-binding CsgD family transcriptional regulator/tetratricopeptide (TPR) repeat protein